MTDVIQLLPDSVANQIAAGEVIQRPASVIKELVENAVDAGATAINVLVIDAGRTLIQVVDDGCGMSETDARLAFERHATSKIRKAEDLFSLQTMGFRGEALPSIAAVAQIELRTKREGEDIGTLLTISGSKIVGQEACTCPVGSNFKVENLFFNVPARRKFLKSNATELNNIIAAFNRIVLVYPEIAFSFHSNGTELFNLPRANQRQRIVDLFGKRLNQDLLPVEADTTLCRITGFVGRPESAHKKGVHQYFFVNGRYMRHAYFHKAVQTALERMVPAGEQVPYFLYFSVPPEDIDVNIHPTKTEIKFENEQAIWQILSAAVKEALGLFSGIPSLDFDIEGKPEIPVFSPDSKTSMPKENYNPQYNPFDKGKAARSSHKPVSDWERLYGDLIPPVGDSQQQLFESSADLPADNSPFGGYAGPQIAEKAPVHYQYKGQYVLTAVKSGLMVVDQHRAHVRILYEEYLKRESSQKVISQQTLFPEIIQLSMEEDVVMAEIAPRMEDMGFELTNLGGNSYSVNAIPAGIEGVNPINLLRDIIADARHSGMASSDEVWQTLALNLARHAAIPYGQVLSNDEMENLVNSLFACTNINYTPDGKKILNILPQQEIEKLLA